jgi:hypothetical protein
VQVIHLFTTSYNQSYILDIEINLNHVTSSSLPSTNNESPEQRSQIVSNSLNRFPFLGSFKRQLSEVCTSKTHK